MEPWDKTILIVIDFPEIMLFRWVNVVTSLFYMNLFLTPKIPSSSLPLHILNILNRIVGFPQTRNQSLPINDISDLEIPSIYCLLPSLHTSFNFSMQYAISKSFKFILCFCLFSHISPYILTAISLSFSNCLFSFLFVIA